MTISSTSFKQSHSQPLQPVINLGDKREKSQSSILGLLCFIEKNTSDMDATYN
jgi:hypothetical protein